MEVPEHRIKMIIKTLQDHGKECEDICPETSGFVHEENALCLMSRLPQSPEQCTRRYEDMDQPCTYNEVSVGTPEQILKGNVLLRLSFVGLEIDEGIRLAYVTSLFSVQLVPLSASVFLCVPKTNDVQTTEPKYGTIA